MKEVADELSEQNFVRLLLHGPYGRLMWNMVDGLSEDAQVKYWSKVVPDWIHHSAEENNEGVVRLLKFGRPRAAFSCIRIEPDKIETKILYRVLSEVARGGREQSGEYLINSYDLHKSFDCLNKCPDLTLEEKARLEFAFLEALAPHGGKGPGYYGIPNLELLVEANPIVFVQAVVWAYKRKDDGVDPECFQTQPEMRKEMAQKGHGLLEAIMRIPGHDDLGQLSVERLACWISTVRQSCSELRRAEVADLCVGKLLSHSPVGKDGVWPCEPVRRVLEEFESEDMISGARTGKYNSRGVHWRGEGGDQERELAAKYRKWGQALRVSHPYVSSRLLMGLVKMYDQDASREDLEAIIQRRLE